MSTQELWKIVRVDGKVQQEGLTRESAIQLAAEGDRLAACPMNWVYRDRFWMSPELANMK